MLISLLLEDISKYPSNSTSYLYRWNEGCKIKFNFQESVEFFLKMKISGITTAFSYRNPTVVGYLKSCTSVPMSYKEI